MGNYDIIYIVMIAHEGSGEFSPDNNKVFEDLADSIAYVFDDALNEEAERLYRNQQSNMEGRTGATVEFVQKDVHSLGGIPSLTVLLTESGGKPERGTEKIRLYARATDNYQYIADAAEANQSEGGRLAYFTNEFFIAHQKVTGEWSYSRIDDTTITPWVPALVSAPQQPLAEDLDIIEALGSRISSIEDEELEVVNRRYAIELIDKIDSWQIVPQN